MPDVWVRFLGFALYISCHRFRVGGTDQRLVALSMIRTVADRELARSS